MAARRRLAERITALRKERGLSAKALAVNCDMAASFLSSLENARKSPTLDTLVRLCGVLNVTLPELVGGDEFALRREIENLIQRVPARKRPLLLRVIKDSMLLLVDEVAQIERSKSH